jgi:hypothetical protein
MPFINVTGTTTVKGKPVAVTVTVNASENFAFSKIDQRIIIDAVCGGQALHQSAKVQGAPMGTIGYIHNKAENTIYAVSTLDSIAKTISITKGGQTKANVHVFK